MENHTTKLLILSAPSGSGKTTIIKNILPLLPELEFSISACSRPKRETEIDGKDYYFLSVEEFKKHIENDDFLEWEMVYENQYYGTLKSEINRIGNNHHHVIFDVDVLGGLNIKKQFGEQALSLFIQAPSLEVLEERLRFRSTESEESLKKRLGKAADEMQYAPQFDQIIINDVLENGIERTYNAITNFLK